ncbi:glutathione S-transferase [Caulobacter ginsengisoli]|uniref:Glutathione S-transferase n=1 Tax=Caulobacter ginsengisoli TaxID=400775 RepID=A0ABU0J0I4_9CAUL|nr:glutathione S-transferase C-terminal domain-containing protein [Caulobacter ginsengisoli]MDQ0466727.1 glutathione S-transferase [Caulobacter ginsengisoli]
MKLYLSPGACSLADHIALHEAGLDFERVTVDLKTKTTGDGQDFTRINPKGYVPALQFDDGEVLTENIAILSWIADRSDLGGPGGDLSRARLLEALAFISTEIHKQFKPFFSGGSDEAKAGARQTIEKRLGFLADGLTGDYLFGDKVSVADAYLFVMLMWAGRTGVGVPGPLAAFAERMKQRPAVRLALEHEGLAGG